MGVDVVVCGVIGLVVWIGFVVGVGCGGVLCFFDWCGGDCDGGVGFFD